MSEIRVNDRIFRIKRRIPKRNETGGVIWNITTEVCDLDSCAEQDVQISSTSQSTDVDQPWTAIDIYELLESNAKNASGTFDEFLYRSNIQEETITPEERENLRDEYERSKRDAERFTEIMGI